jgi:hypothetical protein
MLLNVSTSIWYGTQLAEDLYAEDESLWAPAGWLDPRLPQRSVSVDGINGGDLIVDLPQVPSEAEVTAHLVQLAAAIDDPGAIGFRRVYVAQDLDGNYTDIVRDITHTR